MSLSPEQITAVVLAGGFGKRIQHLLQDIPKPMAPVNGTPFLEWVVRYLAAQKIHNVVLSTGHLAQTIESHFQTQPVQNAHISCIHETTPLGTAGGFFNAIRDTTNMPSAWLVLNGDSLTPVPLDAMLTSLDDPNIAGAILGVRVADAARFGTLSLNAHGELAGFSEKRPGEGIINAGVYLFRSSVIGQFPRKTPLSFETDVFQALIVDKVRIKVCVTNAPFLDIGTPETLPLAEEFIRRNGSFFES